METIRGFLDVAFDGVPPAVSIGNFDGVHLGHQAVIGSAVREAAARGTISVACTFDPHTRAFLRPSAAPRLLETLDQRLRAFDELSVDVAIVIPFTAEVASLPREDFVRNFLCKKLKVATMHVSEGFKFGAGGLGTVDYLREEAAARSFSMTVIPPVIAHTEPVSSTRIRDAVVAGRVGEAAELLGRPFALMGEVVAGDGRGHGLGAPTANLVPENGCLPGSGVYVTETHTAAGSFPSVTNVGVRPTFGEHGDWTVETHLLDQQQDLYGARLELGFLRRLRDEKAFESRDELAGQIRVDIEQARAVFGSR